MFEEGELVVPARCGKSSDVGTGLVLECGGQPEFEGEVAPFGCSAEVEEEQ